MSSSTNESSQPVHHTDPLQRPPTASTPLWTHLLRPGNRIPSSLTDIASMAPPLAPLDKNATSMRVLLHDTQANFEKFTIHVEKLLDGIKETKQHIMTTNSLFERDRESLMGDMIDLVNRCQREIQKSIGTPSQSQEMESSFKDINTRLTGLDHRLDSIQAFNQTHSQALQTQIQAVQILLDKQGSIVSAVLPLLPLLQALPLHIDAAKTSIGETLTKLHSNRQPDMNLTVPGTAIKELLLPNNFPKRKRSNGPSSSSSPFSQTGMPPRKKIRTGDTISSPANSLSKSEIEAPLKNSTVILSHSPKHKIPQIQSGVSSVSGLSPSIDAPTSPIHNGSRPRTTMIPSVTPRRPLGDLPIPSALRRSSRRDTSVSYHTARDLTLARSNTLAAEFASTNLLGLTSSAAKPPRLLRVHASITNNAQRAASRVSTNSSKLSSPAVGFQVPPPTSATTENQKITGIALPLNNVGPKTTNNAISLFPRPNVAQEPLPTYANIPQTQRRVPENSTLPMGFNVDALIKSREKTPMLPLGNNKAKERRSPVREGRRFIPLVDSDDDEEEVF